MGQATYSKIRKLTQKNFMIKNIESLRQVTEDWQAILCLRLYNAHFLPCLNYCNIIWGNACKTHLTRIHVLQKRALKIMLRVQPRTSSDLVYSESKALTVSEIFNVQCLIFMYKYVKNMLPEIYQDFFVYKSIISQRSTRNTDMFYLPNSRLSSSSSTLFHRGARLWNDLPDNIRGAATLATFKIRVKAHYRNKRTELARWRDAHW